MLFETNKLIIADGLTPHSFTVVTRAVECLLGWVFIDVNRFSSMATNTIARSPRIYISFVLSCQIYVRKQYMLGRWATDIRDATKLTNTDDV